MRRDNLSSLVIDNEPDRRRGSRPTDILSREWERVWDFMHVVVAEYNIIVMSFFFCENLKIQSSVQHKQDD